ncbi:MAG: hypothetical protein KF824_00640 [Fimbriimonadaceae bacterium]|nr:MAG: hypothetical protein KF824_00640 [Fimbriimonadaceae bacterium]
MKRAILIGVFVALCFSASGTTIVPYETTKKADFESAVVQLDAAMSKRLKIKPIATVKPAQGNITRKEVAARLIALMKHYQSSFRVTPRPFDVYPEVIDKYNKDATLRADLLTLSRWGLIGPVGPLVSNPSENISEEEVGDALGYFYTQITYLSHQPDPRWTPALSDGE